MSLLEIVLTAIVRGFFAFSPLFGLLDKEPEDFALRGALLEEANELAGTMNSRGLLLSWPILWFVSLLSYLHKENKSITPLSVIIMVIVIVVIIFIAFKVKAKYFRPLWVPPVVFCAVTILDAVFNLVLKESIVGLVSK